MEGMSSLWDNLYSKKPPISQRLLLLIAVGWLEWAKQRGLYCTSISRVAADLKEYAIHNDVANVHSASHVAKKCMLPRVSVKAP